MTGDEERFRRALEELRSLHLRLYGLDNHAVVIGGQVLALELASRGHSGELTVETPTGLSVSRGYTLEVDLLFDLDNLSDVGELPERLRDAGLERRRDFRWSKTVEDFTFSVDLFRAQGAASAPPCGMTEAAEGGIALNHNHLVRVDLGATQLEVRVPDGPAFVAMKLAARHLRTEAKDAFDIYSYVRHMGTAQLRADLARPELEELRQDLRAIFGGVSAAGVGDVLSYADFEGTEAALLAQAVVDEFQGLLGWER